MKLWLQSCAVTLLILTLLNPMASASELSEAERTIPMVYRLIGIEAGVPYTILYAIALAETGYTAPSNGQYRPWPWTLNVNGDPYRFDNRTEALALLEERIHSGKRNIDIGLAQINYQYNGSMFPSLAHALDPEVNLRLATYVLQRELEHCDTPDWWCAVGRYHSPGKNERQRANAERYRQRVRSLWEQLQ